MIVLFNLLVLTLIVALVLCILLELRERGQQTPVAIQLADLPTPPTSCPEPSANGGRRVIGLSAEVLRDGIHLIFYIPPNRVGRTSPITSLLSTRCRAERGTLYEMNTRSGSTYQVVMDDDHARQVLRTFYAWKNGAGNGHADDPQAPPEAVARAGDVTTGKHTGPPGRSGSGNRGRRPG